MWTRSYSKVYQGVTKENIWRIWKDVNQWTSWHDDLDYCTMQGAFIVGNHFMMKPKGISPVKIELTEIEEGRKFVDCTKFLGSKMYNTHEVEDTSEGLRLTNTMVVTGPLKWLWIFLVANNVADAVPQEMEALVNIARLPHG